MAIFKIPKDHKDGFNIFFVILDSAQRKVFVETFTHAPAGRLPKRLIGDICDLETINLSKSDITKVVHTLFRLVLVKEDSNLSNEDFISEIASALDEIEIGIEDDAEQDLMDLLESESVGLTVKAVDRIMEREKSLLDTRILTDLRPLFSDDGLNILGSVVVHNLKIEYKENEERREIFMALDNDDMEKLEKSILKAKNKEKLIRDKIKETSLNLIEVKYNGN